MGAQDACGARRKELDCASARGYPSVLCSQRSRMLWQVSCIHAYYHLGSCKLPSICRSGKYLGSEVHVLPIEFTCHSPGRTSSVCVTVIISKVAGETGRHEDLLQTQALCVMAPSHAASSISRISTCICRNAALEVLKLSSDVASALRNG